jgi:hypothetical protein
MERRYPSETRKLDEKGLADDFSHQGRGCQSQPLNAARQPLRWKKVPGLANMMRSASEWGIRSAGRELEFCVEQRILRRPGFSMQAQKGAFQFPGK